MTITRVLRSARPFPNDSPDVKPESHGVSFVLPICKHWLNAGVGSDGSALLTELR